MTDPAPHTFCLFLSDARALEDDVADALFEAGFDDVTFGIQAGLPFADVSRSGVNFEDVVLNTIDSLEKLLTPTIVLRVLIEPHEDGRRSDADDSARPPEDRRYEDRRDDLLEASAQGRRLGVLHARQRADL